ncbi:hypothetical protein WOLCODRAFT_156605 [Wolfiporia cocos MD-104 SS10]|uniref:Uncharacterized protein n=1 Tax=Wolfiporia cocos (strain MD-104) TaxID=742152 RepID=A0A2H3J7Z8_WOLCO|nr:hypothetical protein WOLCODRAFT_156605 [Wolfiporia cocos MD-104 SS10]
MSCWTQCDRGRLQRVVHRQPCMQGTGYHPAALTIIEMRQTADLPSGLGRVGHNTLGVTLLNRERVFVRVHAQVRALWTQAASREALTGQLYISRDGGGECERGELEDAGGDEARTTCSAVMVQITTTPGRKRGGSGPHTAPDERTDGGHPLKAHHIEEVILEAPHVGGEVSPELVRARAALEAGERKRVLLSAHAPPCPTDAPTVARGTHKIHEHEGAEKERRCMEHVAGECEHGEL